MEYKIRHKICEDILDVKTLISYIKQTRLCSFDFETTGLEYYQEHQYPTILSITFQPGSAWVIPLGHFESPFKDNWQIILQLFSREILQDPNIIKFAWNIKFEWKWLFTYGCSLQGFVFDGMLAKYLLDENSKSGLKETVAMLIPEYEGYDQEVHLLIKKHKGWANVPLKPLAHYGALDTDLTLKLCLYLNKRLIDGGFYQLFRNLMMMATRVLAESEWHGIHIDSEYLVNLIADYKNKIYECEQKLKNNPRVRKFEQGRLKTIKKKLIAELSAEVEEIQAGNSKQKVRMITDRMHKIRKISEGEFPAGKKYNGYRDGINFGSPLQMVELFYTHKSGFKFDPPRVRGKSKKGDGPSTNEEALLKLKPLDSSGLIDNLLELRGLQKLFSTYMVGMLELKDKDDLIHSVYKLLTVTGRLSSGSPNMQNIPRVTTNPDVKPMFVPFGGLVQLEVDYSQAELRVVAELSQDQVMIDIFKRNYNIHMATACLLHGDLGMYDVAKGAEKDENHPDHLYWVKLKKKAKTVNFGILYGQGAKALSVGMDCTEKEAEQFIKQWLSAYPGVRKWIKNQQKFAQKNGYVTQIFGRKRRLPDIWSDKEFLRAEAMRQSVNAPIQGAASDFTQFSTIILREMRLKGQLPRYMVQRYTVHDSIGYYVTPNDAHKVVPIITKVCDNPDTLEWFGFKFEHVGMKVSSEVGKNWGSLKDYDPWENYNKLLS